MSKDLSDFSKIGKWFTQKKWTIYRVIFITGVLIFWGWVCVASKLPGSKDVLIWVGPALFAIVANLLVSIAAGVESLADQETFRSNDAYARATSRLERVRLWKISRWKPINIDMIGVTFKNSSGWVETELLPFIKKNSKYYFELRMVFVDKNFLEGLGVSDPDRLSDVSRRETWVKEILWPAVENSNGHLRIHVRTITNIPHWHGIMLERRYLYFGRVSWESEDSERGLAYPKGIICADNGYREFIKDDRRGGDERIDLFRRWMGHYLYGKHKGKVLCDTNTHFYKPEEPVVRPQ